MLPYKEAVPRSKMAQFILSAAWSVYITLQTNTKMKTTLQGWSFMRILRIALGTTILVQGITSNSTASVILGIVFAGMAIANISCCGPNCPIKPGNYNDKLNNEIYEEVDTIK